MNETRNVNLYETDFLEWIQKTAILLREKNYEQLDLENLIEEIEAMGRSEKSQAKNLLTTIIEHLLKIIYWESERDYNLRGSAVLGSQCGLGVRLRRATGVEVGSKQSLLKEVNYLNY